MNVEELRRYCLSKKGVEETFPFDEVTLVFKVMGKMFCLCRLDAEEISVNLKCDPEWGTELREQYPEDIKPGWHMSKIHWNTVSLEGDLSDVFLKKLIDHSYDMVVKGMRKKDRDLLETL